MPFFFAQVSKQQHPDTIACRPRHHGNDAAMAVRFDAYTVRCCPRPSRDLSFNHLSSLPVSLFNTQAALLYLCVHLSCRAVTFPHRLRRSLDSNHLTSIPAGLFNATTALQYLCVLG